jgi:hypothetical protein
MTGEALFVFLLLLATIILFVSDRLRLDVVAMLVILALLVDLIQIIPRLWTSSK